MTWLSWRQFRTPALAGALALAALAAYLVSTGLDIRAAAASGVPHAADEYRTRLLVLAGVLGLVPALIGMFWGAPLIARELETGTHRLVWNQSITRRRWLAVRLATVVLAAAAVAAVAGALLTWAAAPIDAAERFSTVHFGARGLSPVGQAVFAATLGTAAGLLLRRTVPAMALTGLLVLTVLFVVPNLVRPHLMPPRHETRPMTAAAIDEARHLGTLGSAPVIGGLEVPGAWVTSVSELRTPDGRGLDPRVFGGCLTAAPKTGATGTFGDTSPCLAAHDLHVDIDYQPNSRFWPFQYLETSLYLTLAALLAALCAWRIRHRT